MLLSKLNLIMLEKKSKDTTAYSTVNVQQIA